ncbi:VC0807 family protein [Streptomyces sp. NPDC008150]|uniref:VC0807 family protein n=1 Tax=Streptomyces sp. NPDC008150 TaxID=3364816 RepID=UPI0036F14132
MTKNSDNRRGHLANLLPLVLDVAVPVGSYYLLKDAFGVSTFVALAASSVVPAARTVWSVVKDRELNGLAALILFVNVVGLAVGFATGDPRTMLAKDSAASSAIGIGILVSVACGRPMMTAGLKPWLVKGVPEREAAWERLAAGSRAFRRAERVFSLVWGVVLLAECVVRVVGVYVLPVDTMVWLGSVILAVAMLLGFLLGGGLAAGPMVAMLAAEVRGGETAERTPAGGEVPAAASRVAAGQVSASAA